MSTSATKLITIFFDNRLSFTEQGQNRKEDKENDKAEIKGNKRKSEKRFVSKCVFTYVQEHSKIPL